jgi:hypothetical protein
MRWTRTMLACFAVIVALTVCAKASHYDPDETQWLVIFVQRFVHNLVSLH